MASPFRLGTPEQPVRVAVVGAGPAGFFTADALLRRESPVFEVDLLERLPTPFGLVRSGVAPDHQKIKGVSRTFDKTAQHSRFRYLGNVMVGRDISVEELWHHYDQVVFAVGSAGDRRLGIPGEDLHGCHAATAFVGWYNAHPDFRECRFDFSAHTAVVVGVGNVALDVARVLLRNREELAKTDISGAALQELRNSQVREVVLLARRGPAQAAFDRGELEDIANLDDVRVEVDAATVEAAVPTLGSLEPAARKNVEYMLSLARSPAKPAHRVLRLQFLASPAEVLGDGHGKVRAVRVERTQLSAGADGVRASGTGEFHELAAGLVMRSVGYRGTPVPGLPFDDRTGTIPNLDGRVLSAPDGTVIPRTYAVGWIRRGPSGVIGTNKADAQAVAARMLEDVTSMAPAPPQQRSAQAVLQLLQQRGVRVVDFTAWSGLDGLESERGKPHGKVREKFHSVEEMMHVLVQHWEQGP